MHVDLSLRLSLGGDEPLDTGERLFVLLRAVDEHGSLQRASKEAGLSYRAAWGLLRTWSQRLDRKLVVMQRGRGAGLSDFGHRLVREEQRARERLAPSLRQVAAELATALGVSPQNGDHGLTIHASHSMAQEVLRELVLREAGLRLDFHNHGSLASLRALKEHECELAGFHIADGALRRLLVPQFRPWLSDGVRLLRVACRCQGLMMRQEIEPRIAGLADLAAMDTQFVNRQSGSGTRLLLDALLSSESIDPSRIAGYEREEFTHTAVAALLSSGAAQVGFGEEAAARRFGLAFLPLATESYYFAVNDSLATPSPGVRAVAEVLAGSEFRERLSMLGGYDASNSGRWEPAPQLLA